MVKKKLVIVECADWEEIVQSTALRRFGNKDYCNKHELIRYRHARSIIKNKTRRAVLSKTTKKKNYFVHCADCGVGYSCARRLFKGLEYCNKHGLRHSRGKVVSNDKNLPDESVYDESMEVDNRQYCSAKRNQLL